MATQTEAILCWNTEADAVPPHGACEVVGRDEDGRLKVRRPKRRSTRNLVFNGPTTIPGESEGQVYRGFPAMAAVASGPADIGFGDTVGAVPDSWTLATTATGFCLMSDREDDGLAVVAPIESLPFELIKVTEPADDGAEWSGGFRVTRSPIGDGGDDDDPTADDLDGDGTDDDEEPEEPEEENEGDGDEDADDEVEVRDDYSAFVRDAGLGALTEGLYGAFLLGMRKGKRAYLAISGGGGPGYPLFFGQLGTAVAATSTPAAGEVDGDHWKYPWTERAMENAGTWAFGDRHGPYNDPNSEANPPPQVGYAYLAETSAGAGATALAAGTFVLIRRSPTVEDAYEFSPLGTGGGIAGIDFRNTVAADVGVRAAVEFDNGTGIYVVPGNAGSPSGEPARGIVKLYEATKFQWGAVTITSQKWSGTKQVVSAGFLATSTDSTSTGSQGFIGPGSAGASYDGGGNSTSAFCSATSNNATVLAQSAGSGTSPGTCVVQIYAASSGGGGYGGAASGVAMASGSWSGRVSAYTGYANSNRFGISAGGGYTIDSGGSREIVYMDQSALWCTCIGQSVCLIGNAGFTPPANPSGTFGQEPDTSLSFPYEGVAGAFAVVRGVATSDGGSTAIVCMGRDAVHPFGVKPHFRGGLYVGRKYGFGDHNTEVYDPAYLSILDRLTLAEGGVATANNNASSAQGAAADAQNAANNAQNTANNAANAASAAQSTADVAASAASDAQGSANYAQTIAGNAQATANDANAAATNAQNTGNTAQSTADAAAASAAAAQTSADNALAAANNAQTAADAASVAAAAAATAAANSQATADGAATAASNAQTAADIANAAANAAQNAANNAQATADAAQAAVNNLTNDLATANATINDQAVQISNLQAVVNSLDSRITALGG